MSRQAYWDSPIASAMIERLISNVINSGLTLEAFPMWPLLGITNDEKKKEITSKIESLWKLHANSKECDYSQRRTFQQLQQDQFKYFLKDGEVFAIFRYSDDSNRINPLNVQFIDPQSVVDPVDSNQIKEVKERGNTVKDGIEFDSSGVEVAFFVLDNTTNKTVRVQKVGTDSKRVFALHYFKPEYQGQIRGVPFLTGMLHELKKLTDLQKAEIQAAVINALIAVWIEPSAENDSSRPLSTGIIKKQEYQPDPDNQIQDGQRYEGQFYDNGLMVQNLGAGEKLQSYDTKRPNVNVDTFIQSVKRNMTASKGIGVEIVDLLFGSNYSASRATMVFFWNGVINYREDVAADFNNQYYAAWMIGEIEAGRLPSIQLSTPLLSAAWLNANWIGINKPSIDPLKEIRATSEAVKEGLTTREKESQNYNGTSFDENVERLKTENEKLGEANRAAEGENNS
jgi:lambda family phage portal protein